MNLESERSGRRKMKAMKEKLSMGEYLDFFVSPKEVDLPVRFLNQIISMHGFRKLYKARKSTLIEAVNALDLMDPSRTTLKENISPCASITFDDIMLDLKDLSCQECCVISIKTLNFGQDKDGVKINCFSSLQRSTDATKVPNAIVCYAGDASSIGGELSASTSSGVATSGKKKTKKRKRHVIKSDAIDSTSA